MDIRCDRCGAMVPENAPYCGLCGNPLTDRVFWHWLKVVVAVALLLIAAAIGFAGMYLLIVSAISGGKFFLAAPFVFAAIGVLAAAAIKLLK